MLQIISQIAVSEFANMTEQELQNDHVDPRLIFNIHKSSIFLMDNKPTAFNIAVVSILANKNTGQRRAIGYMDITSAAGGLLMHIIHLRDHAYNRKTEKSRPCALYKVSISTNFIYC